MGLCRSKILFSVKMTKCLPRITLAVLLWALHHPVTPGFAAPPLELPVFPANALIEGLDEQIFPLGWAKDGERLAVLLAKPNEASDERTWKVQVIDLVSETLVLDEEILHVDQGGIEGFWLANENRVMELIKAVEDEPSLKALRAGIDFLESDPRVKATHIGSIGWCFGGHWSLRTALLDPDLDACVLYYGRPVTEVAQLAGIKAEVLGVFGTQDASLPEETVGGFEAALKEAGVKARILRYDAVHAFANPSNPKYDQVSAGKAWDEVRELFGRTLKPGK